MHTRPSELPNELPSSLIEPALAIAREASDRILEIYDQAGREDGALAVETKSDDSPLTAADRAAHESIVHALARLTPDIPILSEESRAIPWQERSSWRAYWLVDPLDGTKEFIKRNGEFTVNIALVVEHRPVLGVVHVPVSGQSFYGARGHGSFERDPTGDTRSIQVTSRAQDPVRVVGSRSHRNDATNTYLERLGDHVMVPMGSSLKFCVVARGQADIYPRLGPTSEWDTAAAQAVVENAGGHVVTLDGAPLAYNTKDELLNPNFLVYGDVERDWTAYARG